MEPTRDGRDRTTCGVDARNELRDAASDLHPRTNVIQRRHRHSAQRRDPLAQALGEVELTAHRTLGDRRHRLASAGVIGDELDHLVLDERRVDVEHDEQARHRTVIPLPTTVIPPSVTVNPRSRSAA